MLNLSGELNPDLKANLNGHPSLGSKSYIFMENGKTISLSNVSIFSICRNFI